MKSDAFYFGNGPEETERYKRPLDIPLSGMLISHSFHHLREKTVVKT